jgi:hypothetical protein
MENDINYRFQMGGLRSNGQEVAPVGDYYFKTGGPRDSRGSLTQNGLEILTVPGGSLLAPATWHSVEVIALGNVFRLFFNGKEVSAFRDVESRLENGSIEFRLLKDSQVSLRKILIKELNGDGGPINEPGRSRLATPF